MYEHGISLSKANYLVHSKDEGYYYFIQMLPSIQYSTRFPYASQAHRLTGYIKFLAYECSSVARVQ